MNNVLVGIINNIGITYIKSMRSINTVCNEYKNTGNVICTHGSVSSMRNSVVEYFLKEDYSHLLFLDTDMVFPDDAIYKLLKEDKDIISGVYHSKTNPPKPVFYDKIDQGYKYVDNYNTDIQEVSAVGCGCLMIKKKVFERLEKPYFLETITDYVRVGEDIYFCEKAKHAGYNIYINFNVGCGHIMDIVIPPPEIKGRL